MKYYISILSFLFAFQISYSQQTWNTKINYESGDNIVQSSSFFKTIDNNYLFLYERCDNPLISTNPYTHALAKYDTQGQLIWEKIYDSHENTVLIGGLIPRKATEMSNGDIVVVGRKRPEYIAYMYLANSEGDSLMYKTYPQYSSFNKVSRINENTIVVDAGDKTTNKLKILTINLVTGNIETISQYDLPPRTHYFPEDSDHFFGFNPVSDSIIIEKYAYTGETLLAKKMLTPEGFGTGDGFMSGIALNTQLSGNGLIIYNNAILVLDDELNSIFSVPFNEDNLNVTIALMDWHESNFILPTSDGGFLLSGSTNTNGGNYNTSQVYFIKINSLGVEEWSNWYYEFLLPDNYVPFIIEESDGYIFIRHNYVNQKIHMTKMNKLGQLVKNNNIEYTETIKIYPNPCFDYLSVNIPEAFKDGQMAIYSLQGRLVHDEDAVQEGYQIININHLEAGGYFLKLTNETGEVITTSKLIKR